MVEPEALLPAASALPLTITEEQPNMRIFFSVGEPSGDLHGSNLIRHLQDANPDFEFVGFGGPKMKAAGCELIYDLTQMAVMFLSKVIANLRFFFGLVDQADDLSLIHI